MDRYLIGVLAVLVALPLFAFPLASPVSQGDQHVRIDANAHGDRPAEYEPSVNYSALSADAQALFDEARDSAGGVSVALEEAADYWRERATSDDTRRVLVRLDDGPDYLMFTDLYTPGPSGSEVLTRLGSLVASILIGISGAYLIYKHRGVE